MPADKPVGSFDATINVVAYPHAADLDTSWQYSDRADGVAFSDDYFSEIGGIQNDWLNAGGSAEDRTGYHVIGTDGSAKQVLVNRCVAAGASTYELGFVVRSTAGSNSVFLGLGDTGGNFNFNSISLTNWENYLSGASNIALNGGSPLSVGDFVHGIFSSDGTSTVTLRVYVNELFVGSTTGTLNAAADFGALAGAAPEVNPEGNYSLVFRNYYSSELSSGAADDNSGEPYATVGAVLTAGAVDAEAFAAAADDHRVRADAEDAAILALDAEAFAAAGDAHRARADAEDAAIPALDAETHSGLGDAHRLRADAEDAAIAALDAEGFAAASDAHRARADAEDSAVGASPAEAHSGLGDAHRVRADAEDAAIPALDAEGFARTGDAHQLRADAEDTAVAALDAEAFAGLGDAHRLRADAEDAALGAASAEAFAGLGDAHRLRADAEDAAIPALDAEGFAAAGDAHRARADAEDAEALALDAEGFAATSDAHRLRADAASPTGAVEPDRADLEDDADRLAYLEALGSAVEIEGVSGIEGVLVWPDQSSPFPDSDVENVDANLWVRSIDAVGIARGAAVEARDHVWIVATVEPDGEGITRLGLFQGAELDDPLPEEVLEDETDRLEYLEALGENAIVAGVEIRALLIRPDEEGLGVGNVDADLWVRSSDSPLVARGSLISVGGSTWQVATVKRGGGGITALGLKVAG